MEPIEKPKMNWQRLLITSGFVLASALIVGGTTWYVMDRSARDIKTAGDNTISELQKQIKEKKPLAEVASPISDVRAKTPVIAWTSAGDFSTIEKAEITTKVIEPYLYYENISGKNIVSAIIIEIPEGNKGPNAYSYTIYTVSDKGFNSGWTFGENNVIDYWKPVCGLTTPAIAEFGKCPPNYEDYKLKYPSNWSV